MPEKGPWGGGAGRVGRHGQRVQPRLAATLRPEGPHQLHGVRVELPRPPLPGGLAPAVVDGEVSGGGGVARAEFGRGTGGVRNSNTRKSAFG